MILFMIMVDRDEKASFNFKLINYFTDFLRLVVAGSMRLMGGGGGGS